MPSDETKAAVNETWKMARHALASGHLDSGEKRWEFLNSVMVCFLEHAGYGNWFTRVSWHDPDDAPMSAIIVETAQTMDDNDYRHVSQIPDDVFSQLEHHSINHDFLEAALETIRNNSPLGKSQTHNIVCADLLNDASQLDVLDCLAILEVGLFGEVKYA